MKILKIMNTKKNIPFYKSANYSLDKYLNFKNFKYRTLEEREREKEKNKSNSRIKMKNFSIEYKFNNNVLFNRNILRKKNSNFTTFNRSNIASKNKLLLSGKCSTYQSFNNLY